MVQRTELMRFRRHRPSAKPARDHARKIAEAWGLGSRTQTFVYCVNELVSNALIHGQAGRGSNVTVSYHRFNEFVRVEVRDAATGLVRFVPNDPNTDEVPEEGYGLILIQLLTDRWGVSPRVLGKVVWFELNLVRNPDRCELPA